MAQEIILEAHRRRSPLASLFGVAQNLYHLVRRGNDETEPAYQKKVVREFAKTDDLRVLGKLRGSSGERWLALFEDVFFVRIQVEQHETGVLNSTDFFEKLFAVADDEVKTGILTTSREFYNGIQVVEAPE